MKKLNLSGKFLVLGAILVIVFNPLSVRIWEDALLTGLAFLADKLVLISDYTVVVGGSLILASLVLYLNGRSKKETKKLKKLKSSKTQTAGQYIES